MPVELPKSRTKSSQHESDNVTKVSAIVAIYITFY